MAVNRINKLASKKLNYQTSANKQVSDVFVWLFFLQVEVANPSDRKVNFGALRVGQTSQRNLKLVNRSPAPITFTLAITPAVVALQQANILTISPSSEITLRANGGSCGVELTFKPKSRIPHFTEEVCAMLCYGVVLAIDSHSM